tara:strand:- start:53206 stop:54273 length:1068 start_codon:yes stop_codon:yes gene_type:complete
MAQPQLPDFSQIMKLAQKVASQIEPPEELRSGKKPLTEEEMTSAISKITKSVSEVVKPDMLMANSSKKMGKQKVSPLVPVKKEESKISLDVSDPQPGGRKEKKKRVVEIESDDSDDNDPIAPRTKDMAFTLSVSLEELYSGTKKKLALRRNKIDTDGSYEEEKKKLSIKIEPGMIDEQTIRFNHMADEKQGYETGDVVVTLDVEEHAEFVRDGNNLLLEKEISLAEAYNPVLYFKHLNGETFKITGEPFDIFGDEDDMLKKISGCGMPVLGEPGSYGDLFIRFKCVNKTKITGEIVEVLTRIFPPLLEKPDIPDEELNEKQFETVTETDLEFLEDSDSDDDYSDESYSEESSDEN